MSKFDRLLSKIDYPKDLKALSEEQLPELCEELRNFIIESVSNNPGHLGANLGVVELTVALHYVFNTPYDKIVWDVGHQAYCHKILTGRKDKFDTNRKYKGISGYPKMSESEYDSFGVGHSSTSISAALGMAISAKYKGMHDRNHIAIIGDGSMTGGIAFEAMNHAGDSNANILVILNDNGIAIDPNTGALKDYLLDITTSEKYNKLKDNVWNLLESLSKYEPNTIKIVQNIQNIVKGTLLKQSNYFESLKFRYFGPVDGHDVQRLVKLLDDMKKINGPKLLHLITVKGKGFEKAEQDQTKFHAPGYFNKDTGDIIEKKETSNIPPKYQDVFGNTLLELTKLDNRVVGITPAMGTSCSMHIVANEFKDRIFDVGIAEQHAVTFSAGLAADGLIPVCNIYSSFAQRAYDQILHDVALQSLPVIFCLDRSGLVGEDGATHHGSFDLAFMRSIPNLIISAPMNEHELRNLMYSAVNYREGPFSIRYPRGQGVLVDWHNEAEQIVLGKGRVINEGNDIVFLTIGHVGNFVVQAIKELNQCSIFPAHYDMRFLKPIDSDLLHSAFEKYNVIVTVEDGTIVGGLGTEVTEFMVSNLYNKPIIKLGIPDQFIEHGKPEELYKECGYDKDSIVKLVLNYKKNQQEQRHHYAK
ncbi:MAG: 1-deoxy-D-xylulose-5-phosphate synthase [Bacteroidetes bacterium GWE2_29_8]|nr:MAG: 1-deoxy-D-xylulose-5-phosphate synthase [Bacteroidetes bacterium GWE2_29_8]